MNRWVALLGVTALTVYLSWKVLEPFVEVLILGIALTVIFQPVHQRFVKWTRGNRVAAALSTVFTMLVLIIPFTFVCITVVNEVPSALEALASGFESVRKSWDATVESGSWLATWRENWHLDNYFSPEKVKARHHWAYLPFSLGPRICIGNVFALTEAVVLFSMLLQRIEFDMVDPDAVRLEASITLRPVGAVPLRIRWRN